MSLLKMGKAQESIPIFQTLARDPSLGYYSILAYYRLTAMPGAPIPATVETHFGLKRPADPNAKATEEEVKAAAAAAEEARIDYEAALAKAEGVGEPPGAEGSADAAVDAADEGDKDVADADESSAEPSVIPPLAGAPAPLFKDANLAIKFERVRDLVLVGLEDGARRELREIEKRAQSVADRKLLMSELANVKNYERSSYIGEVGFGAARLAGGLKGDGRVYWEYAYPRAWESSVAQASRSTSVPEELIWGIMRAESHYRYDAQSPVGAMGLMQLMPFTGRKVADLMNVKAFEVRTLLEPETNIRFGSRYLQRLIEKFAAKVPLVAAAYNAGPHRVHAWVRNFGTLDMDEFIEHIPYVETRNYVKRVARNFQIYGLLYHANAKSMAWVIQPVGVQLNEPYPQKEIW
jgi:soluble lytic murein transglycosylase